VTGDIAMAEEYQQHYLKNGITACVKAFENRMDIAWQAADIVVCRSGAGTIAEQLEFEVPGILIPFPRAANNHQEHNADFMVAIVGGAVKLCESTAPSRLISCLFELLKEDGTLLASMKQSMKNYKKRARSKDLFSLVNELL
jgi:UDP-N-acetylglucosamine--N-acetylmuramyl-(pentapeptide) pyrophosphoryl-undecaprenol N-acetylglucosamine transferase